MAFKILEHTSSSKAAVSLCLILVRIVLSVPGLRAGRERLAYQPNSRKLAASVLTYILSTDFCSSSSSPSFQPIKSHITIPTAHVIPSTLGTSPAKPNSTPAGPSSSKLSLPGLAESVALTRNGDLAAMKRSPGLPREFMYLCGTTGENGIEQSWFPAVGYEREEEVRRFDIPSMESTLNQSAVMETLYSDPHYRVHFHNPRTETNKELYKVLPETKKAPGSGAVCERNGPHPSSSGVLPLGLQPAPGLSKPLPSQMWQPNPDPWHPRERSCELSTCRQQLELIRLQMEQMQVEALLPLDLASFAQILELHRFFPPSFDF